MAEWETLAVGQDRSATARVDVAQVFAVSYRKLVVQLYGVVGDAGEAEDLVQEAFVRAYAAGSRFTRVDNPEAWLRTTAINLYRNRWRKLRNFARIKEKIPHPSDLPGIGEHVEVVDALRRLPQSLRVVLVLHYLRPPGAPDRRRARDRRGHGQVTSVARPGGHGGAARGGGRP